ncbi:GroES-like protein [Sodiomyces alkalinus F11]|uniref:GroES-like protein n=1 Tax=Sodiomyces alkalinus (strain CBS 110278 / VKM F-3762 / F11) TaxID=1314773 RepID=A0A3N2PZG3_SODAK|nr:GroES-like protein [Sodiomyces alkalinus F11]ROT39818.1 GroES-like protein [Sodiomyces alkalinus F11]
MSQNQEIRIVSVKNVEITDVPIPDLPSEEYILVRTTAVAVNPSDWKHMVYAEELCCVGARLGYDYAGVVEKVGSAVTKDFKKGDRIAGFTHGANGQRQSDGAFAKYIIVKGDIQMKIPDHFTDEEAATLGVSVATVGQGLYQALKLPLPNEPTKEPFPVLIYGGSTATGVYAIQFAKLSGLKVIATSSPHNFDYLKSIGADAVFDYKSPTVVEDIRNYANGALTVAYDCHAGDGSNVLCARCLSDDGGRIHALLGPNEEDIKAVNPKIESSFTAAYSVVGEGYHSWGKVVPPSPEDFEFAKTFMSIVQELLDQGKVKPIRIAKNRGGESLQGVLSGLKEQQEGKVSGEKLVYTI